MQLIDLLTSEFRTRSKRYYLDVIECGVVTVNNNRVQPTYRLKDLDIIRHTVHIHEPVPPKIEIIKEEMNYWVVNKPSGIPCHPTGGYYEYSVTRSLFKDKIVGCVNRLDMPVSGVLIITSGDSNSIHNLLTSAEKIYIARVKGRFPDAVTVDKAVGLVGTRIFDVSETGKPSCTHFKLLEYKNGHSLIECRPITGRTHQIRIHCKFLGFPILNDILYGSPERVDNGPKEDSSDAEYNCEEECIDGDEKHNCIIRNCKGTANRSFEIRNSFVCLHAWKYEFNGVLYEAPWPKWADLDISKEPNS